MSYSSIFKYIHFAPSKALNYCVNKHVNLLQSSENNPPIAAILIHSHPSFFEYQSLVKNTLQHPLVNIIDYYSSTITFIAFKNFHRFMLNSLLCSIPTNPHFLVNFPILFLIYLTLRKVNSITKSWDAICELNL